MKTASFRTYTGPGRISIARGARGIPAGFRVFRAPAPGPWFNQVGPTEYRRRYHAEILGRLDPRDTYAPFEPMLMCWEDLCQPDVWCHRRPVTDRFAKTWDLRSRKRRSR